MKRAGIVNRPDALEISTRPASSGSLSASSTSRRQLVEEEDTAVGKRYLARPRRTATTDQSGSGHRVVRRPERPPDHRVETTADAADPGHFECLFTRQVRQDGRQPPGGQGLARAGRADHQQSVSTGSRNLERPPQSRLAP
jgi:hypothetical protein